MLTAGDFDAILAQTHPALRAYLAGLGIPPEDVDDVAQEVYVDFYGTLERVPDDIEPLRWLKGMARNRALNHFRRRGREGQRKLEVVAELLAQVPDASAPADDRRDALRGCLQELAPRSAGAVRMRYEQGLSSGAIGQALGMSAAAVRILLMRARSALRACVEAAP